ncbi:MAG TPA: hypothetical protein VGK73_40625 [Polyangiaceae bacterium]
MDLVLLALVSLSFGLFVTAQLVLVLRLAREGPAWRALVGFLFPPAAAYFCFRGPKRGWPGVWLAALLSYALLLLRAGWG